MPAIEYPHDERFQRNQALFYETGDPKYAWAELPDIEHAVRVALKKQMERRGIWMPPREVEARVQRGSEIIISRMLRHLPPIKNKLVTYCYFTALQLLYGREWQQRDFENRMISYDNIVEKTGCEIESWYDIKEEEYEEREDEERAEEDEKRSAELYEEEPQVYPSDLGLR